MNKYMEEAKAIRASISGLADGADDEKLIDNMAAFPYWNPNGVDYSTGDILQDDGKLYRVIQPHRSQADWKPENVPALFNRITAEDWEEWQSGNFYSKGAKVKHNGKKWISNVDNNHWEPGATGVYTWDEMQSNAD